ncbi:acyl-CoA dehydrogenase family protein [Sedimentibacter saalensis]|uniref:Alkylation response protein AidB-like acyl-CoA dehydrogenase n=1 Tax=Sedimentibacter saalensis TaxID=130788 RepID=A0A562J115_9FIRM|nr:acyl-CoA dehydrogenase family protein [Sedimentibacter saalensis]MEA5095511.1 acyl-CoA dehydrogenase family protein [Sedimentibacter saalensis]TWH76991.1 alkylation response protein AidB-like acyl-CoA dehydrogenase [Sedimentibacter saalensis]
MFDFTDRQLELQQRVRKFVNENIFPNLELIDKGEYQEELFKEWCKTGLVTLVAPKAVGGIELDTKSCAIVMEELGYGDVGVATGFGANNLGSYPLLISGTLEQQKQHFGPILEGKYGAFALTEPGAGSDAGAVATTAERKGDEYILNGTKCFITQGGFAIDMQSSMVVFASTDRTLGSKGLSAFLVKGGTPGIRVGKIEDKMGIRGSQTVELVIEDLHVPASSLLGEEGDGMKIAMKTLDSGRLMVAAQGVGCGQRALDLAVDYVKKQVEGVKPLAKQQAIAFKIAEMEASVEAARQLVYRGAFLKDNKQPYSHHSAITKLFATEMAMNVANSAMEIMGSYGYSKESGIEKVWRDARILSIYEGTNQVQRLVISGGLLR